MLRAIDEYYSSLLEPNRSCMEALREIILSFDPLMTERPAWGMPFFYYGKHRFCYLWIDPDSRQPCIGIVDGKLLDFPGLVMGSRKRMKVFFIDPLKNIPVARVARLLKRVRSLYN